jgi:hypothetical protein
VPRRASVAYTPLRWGFPLPRDSWDNRESDIQTLWKPVSAITVRSRISFYYAGMGREQTALAPMCPSCGKPMGLSRTIPASAGFRELQTFGCRDCGVWVTEDPWATKRGLS